MKLVKCVAAAVIAVTLAGCSGAKPYNAVSGLDKDKQVTIKIAIPYETNKALNTAANAFSEKYPNVSFQLQYIEDYDNNATKLFYDNAVDIILKKDVPYFEESVEDEETGEKTLTGLTADDYYYDFAADTEIDFSNTTPDLTDNYKHTRTDADGKELTYQYCYPLGGEMRGIFVNVTLLNSLGLSVPQNYDEFVACCEALKQKGYIAIQGNPATLAYGVGFAQAANTVVHNSEALKALSEAKEGVSVYFKDAFSKLYDLAVNRYVDYKAVEPTGYFVNSSEAGQSNSFLGLSVNEETYEVIKPENNSGYVAFFPYISSTETVINDLIDEYGLDTEFKFICSPLNDKSSNSPVYITPYYGICINKQSESLDWLREFINFLFQEDNIKQYAENASIIPNSTDALQYVADKYELNVDTDITLCGQINFSSDYNAFKPISNGLVSVAKCNAQKYMVALNKDADGNIQYETDEDGKQFLYLGNGETKVYKEFVGEEDTAMPGFAFCTLQYYMNALEDEFAAYRVE